MRITDTCVYFYTFKDVFSNFYKSSFIVGGIKFCCGEQFIMNAKALLFEDYDIAEKIMKETFPKNIKFLGRRVKNFDKKKWNENRENITYIGLLAKFKQNQHLKNIILSTGNKDLVEASPTDAIWGIGMSENHPDIENKKLWGENILGKILMKVRNHIHSEDITFNLLNKSLSNKI